MAAGVRQIQIESMKTAEERLASIETTLAFHGKTHSEITEICKNLDSKVDSILIHHAEKTGEAKATKKIAALVSAVISLLVTLVIAYFQN